MPEFIYQTQDGRLAFEDTNGWINIWRKGIEWGVPQADWALRALINDIKKLKEENEQLKMKLG